MNHSAPLLEINNVTVSFKAINAVTDISFAVNDGEICALIGPNGAGKSSLLNVINGVYQASAGSITFAGITKHKMTPHYAAVKGIARTFQNIALFKGMSVLDNILTGRNQKAKSSWLEQVFNVGRAPKDILLQRLKAEKIIDFLHLHAWRETPVSTLPYGLQKRVEFGRALAAEPRLLLLDEPMAGMNADEKQEMCEFIIDAKREFGTAILLIEHDISVVMNLSDHVVVLDYGKKIGDGIPEQVRKNPDVIAAYLGTKH